MCRITSLLPLCLLLAFVSGIAYAQTPAPGFSRQHLRSLELEISPVDSPVGTAIRQGGVTFEELREQMDKPTLGFHVAMWWISEFRAAGVTFDYSYPLSARDAPPQKAVAFGRAQAGAGASSVLLNLVGELNIGFFEGSNILTIGAGPRLTKILSDRVAIYGHVQAGILRDFGFTDFMLQPGGGVIFALEGQRLLFSAGIDFPIDFFDGGSQTGRRIRGGVIVPLGR